MGNYQAADKAAAERGDVHYWMALYALANLESTPPEEAIALLKTAYDGTVALAPRAIARHYAEGSGAAKDPKLALRWLKLGAEQGDPWAEFDLGRMYFEGNAEYGIQSDWETGSLPFYSRLEPFR